MNQEIPRGWAVEGGQREVSKVFNGHIDLQDAINQSGDVIKNTDGAYVKAFHDVEVSGLAKWSGSVGD